MIRISNIRMPLDYQPEQLEKKVCKLLRTRSGIQAIHLVKQSVDARKKSDLPFVLSVDVEADRDNTSIENQKDIISDYVQRYFPNSELTFFVDRDRSGYTFEQREDYQRMRPYLMTGQYDVLIIKDLSRFSRRNSRGLVELEDLRDAGVRIVAIGDSIDYPTHDDWTNIRLRFLLNEMPVTDSSQKVKSVISRRQQDGRWICSVPYGYVMKTR